jgi:hypothetical protein
VTLRTRFLCRTALGLLVVQAATGCGSSGPEIADVTGKVLKDGKPIAGANVTYFPSSGRPSYGTSDKDGLYSLDYTESAKGAVVGSHTVKVTVGGAPPPPDASSSGRNAGFRPPVESIIPGQILVKSGSNSIDLNLP